MLKTERPHDSNDSLAETKPERQPLQGRGPIDTDNLLVDLSPKIQGLEGESPHDSHDWPIKEIPETYLLEKPATRLW